MVKVRDYFALLRLPAVFTVVADVMMAYLVARGDLTPWPAFAAYLVGACCLYLAGMAFNDAYDADQDALERPERPIPSGRVSRAAAVRIGWSLWSIGVGLIWLASGLVETWVIGFGGLFLAGGVWTYNRVSNHAAMAVVLMAFCRVINVILAMGVAAYSLAPVTDSSATEAEWAIAGAVALYLAGITWFSRSESGRGSRRQLTGAMLVMLLGLALYAGSPLVHHARQPFVAVQPLGWLLLWLAIAAVILGRCALAAVRPEPRSVQAAVRTALRSLIVIDAAVVLAVCGAAWGVAVLALVVPMTLLESWFSTT